MNIPCRGQSPTAEVRPCFHFAVPRELGFGSCIVAADQRVGSLIGTELGGYESVAAWSSAAAAVPISISGIDAHSKSGTVYVDADGAATSALDHDEAIPIPVDAEINAYLAAGRRHYGVID